MIRSVQNSFVAGELSPNLHGRHDLKAYFQGAQRVLNFAVRKSGGLRKRAGTDIMLDLSAFPGCRLIPFFYDRTRSTLILLHGLTARFIIRRSDGSLGFSAVSGADYTIAVPWETDDLTTLKYHQLGDTVYLSAPGYQAAKLVRYSDTSWRLAYITGTAIVNAPSTLTAVASGFSDGSSTSVTYGLFAQKNGILSPPRTKTVSIHTPWNAGAKVVLNWTPEPSLCDGYVLGKKSGSGYGLLAELTTTRDLLDLTGKTLATSGVSHVGVAANHVLAASHDTALRATDPNAKANTEILLNTHNYAFHIVNNYFSDENGSGYGDPFVKFTASGTFAVAKIGIWCGAVCADTAKQNIVTVDYQENGLSIYVERATNTANTEWTEIAQADVYPQTAAGGYVEIPVTGDISTSSSYKRRIWISSSNHPEDTGVIIRGIAMYDAAGNLIPGAFVLGDTANYAFRCLGVSGWVNYGGTVYLVASLDITSAADNSSRNNLSPTSASPKRYLSADANGMALVTASDAGSYYATISLTNASAVSISEFRLYLGAESVNIPAHAPGSKEYLDSNTLTAEIYTYNGSAWTAVAGSVTPVPNVHLDSPVSIPVPDGDYSAVLGWRLRIKAATNAPVIIRGCTFFTTVLAKTFTDTNFVTTTLINAQRYINPGGNLMSVDLVSMHQQRLVLASCDTQPFTLWFSKAGEIEMWYASSPVADDDPFSATIPATRASRIRAMIAEKRLILFTDGGVYVMDSGTDGFSYRTARIDKICNSGIGSPQPVSCVNTVLFVADDNRTLYELRYDFAQDNLIPIDRSVLSAHLTEASPVFRTAWAEAPDATLWTVLADGTLLSYTTMPEHEVYAWARHTLQGVDRVLDIIATGAVEERQYAETASQIFLLAECGANTYLLKMRPPVSSDTPSLARAACLDMAQAVHVLAGGTIVGYEAEALTGDWTPPHPYPDGLTLTSVNLATGELNTHVTGGINPGKIVGKLPLGNYIIGIPVPAELHTLRPELPSRNIQALRKTVGDSVIRLHRSRAIAAAALDAARPMAPVTRATTAAAPAAGLCPLADGDIKLAPFSLLNNDGRLAITSVDPWPCEILSVISLLNIEDFAQKEEDQR